MSYFSKFYQVEVRDNIVREFTNSRGEVDDMMAGLHEIRVRMAEKEYNLISNQEIYCNNGVSKGKHEVSRQNPC